MKKILRKTVLIFLVSLILFSCASNSVARNNAKQAYKQNDYETAISYLKAENADQDLIDLNLDEAMLLSLNGNYKESANLFNITNYKMSLLSGEMTVGQIIAAGLSSENSVTYSGPAYEYSLLDSMNAFNYMKINDFDSARAMMRRSFNNNKQAFNELKAKSKEVERQSEMAFNSSSTQKSIKDMEGEGLYYDFNSFSGQSHNSVLKEYNLSPFNFYLGAVLFANDNDLYTAYDWLSNIKPFISRELSDSIINIPEGKGSINVVTLSDTIVRREEAFRLVPMVTDIYGLRIDFKLTWPYVPESYNIVDKVLVQVTSQNTSQNSVDLSLPVTAVRNAELIEDFDDAVRTDVASKAEGAFTRSLIRNITRKTAAYIGGIIAVNTASNLSEDTGVSEFVEAIAIINAVAALQITINAIDSNEHADTRQCVFFPSKARCAGIILDPGIYTVTVSYLDKTGRVLKYDTMKDVHVIAGRPSIVPSEFINTGNFKYQEIN